MAKRLVMFVLAVGLSAPPSAQDARAVLQASLKAMGGEKPQYHQYSGAGWSSQIGQTYGSDGDWPHFEVAGYTRVIDYDAKWSREDYTRRQGSYPTFRPRPMAEAACHCDSQRQLRVGHERQHAGAVHADVSRWRAVQHPRGSSSSR
jgi:hypothetical protein